MLVLDVCQKFAEKKIPYVLVGGIAMAFQGVIRATFDVDLIVSLKPQHLSQAEEVLNSLGLQSRLPLKASEIAEFHREYIEKRNLIAWSFVDFKNPTRQVDLLINQDVRKIESDNIKVSGQVLKVASIQALIVLKTQAGRPQDLLDIEELKQKIK